VADITKDIPIEDLIHEYSGAVSFLIKHDLPCVVCGEPFWGTLEELARQKDWDDDKIQALVDEFNQTH
jgi:Ni,Fe-hydrogenase I small subunit